MGEIIRAGRNSKDRIVIDDPIKFELKQYDNTKLAFQTDGAAQDIQNSLQDLDKSLFTQFRNVVTSLDSLPDTMSKIDDDSTKTPAHRAILNYDLAHKKLNNSEKELNDVLAGLRDLATQTEDKLFTSNSKVNSVWK